LPERDTNHDCAAHHALANFGNPLDAMKLAVLLALVSTQASKDADSEMPTSAEHYFSVVLTQQPPN